MTTDPKEAAEILTGIYVSTEYTQTDVAEFLTDFAAAVRAEQKEEDARRCNSLTVNRKDDPLANQFDGGCRACATVIRKGKP